MDKAMDTANQQMAMYKAAMDKKKEEIANLNKTEDETVKMLGEKLARKGRLQEINEAENSITQRLAELDDLENQLLSQ
eukprot:CAMPEP_0113944224 /NCGR_PEP_ID=MMETSP1339-20121228/31799_1 /TAXON_ID=94617 /ORGANISM="Fibrocapsa japonica" /LENGTH=77 /DNA_ID=CAMNT_0000949343 /DNA_START=270 /DNA_END=503 /DNA_ORIENTATION=- /assembly_acc=CAM_ASM_000762